MSSCGRSNWTAASGCTGLFFWYPLILNVGDVSRADKKQNCSNLCYGCQMCFDVCMARKFQKYESKLKQNYTKLHSNSSAREGVFFGMRSANILYGTVLLPCPLPLGCWWSGGWCVWRGCRIGRCDPWPPSGEGCILDVQLYVNVAVLCKNLYWNDSVHLPLWTGGVFLFFVCM